LAGCIVIAGTLQENVAVLQTSQNASILVQGWSVCGTSDSQYASQ